MCIRDRDIIEPTLSKELVVQLQVPMPTNNTFSQVSGRLEDSPQTFYYYKRWLWMIFPLACQNLKCNYSDQMKLCQSKSTEYMNAILEQKFTKQAVYISLEAKFAKQKILASKTDDLSQEKASLEFIKKQLRDYVIELQQNDEIFFVKKVQKNDREWKKSQQESSKLQLQQLFEDSKITEDTHHFQQQNSKGGKDISIQDQQYQQQQQAHNLFLTEALNQSKFSLPPLNLSRSQDQFTNASKIITRNRNEKFKYYDAQIFPQTTKLKNTVNSSSILPRLKNSINDHTQSEINTLDKQIKSFRIEYNSLIAQNAQLAKQLAQLQIIYNKQADGGFSQKTDMREKVIKLSLIHI
eukprot:TRINITY_DN11318_c0_g1_i1.p1 TRINITY_DN11318_c0_g1~~TRINITY_DN11318_c0_g1_i1.p1  ORF type:complete len:361 (-),score=32.73 TRINITY_DN11318_c0_g1_i1:132-1187(-)